MNEPNRTGRCRPVLAVVGSAGALEAPTAALASELGRLAVEARFRIVTGGLGGVMEAVSRGARSAASRGDGDVVGVLPGYDRRAANAYVDIVVPTGMQIARNVIVAAMADVVVAVGGGAGTLSEVAVAWQLGKPVIALAASGGWSARLAGERIDGRRDDLIHGAATADEAIALALHLVAEDAPEPGDIGSGWKRGAP
jgi:uncharacterized protein (TIGR00725 family)